MYTEDFVCSHVIVDNKIPRKQICLPANKNYFTQVKHDCCAFTKTPHFDRNGNVIYI